MHNLKPNTVYKIITIEVAVTEADFLSDAYTDGINCMMDCGIFEEDGKDGVVADWRFSDERVRRQDEPRLFDRVPRATHVTGDVVEEGETFHD